VSEFGPVGIVMNRDFVANATVLSPMDTGDYTSTCNATFTSLLCSQMGSDPKACGKFWFCAFDISKNKCDSMQAVLKEGVEYGSPGCEHWDHAPGSLRDFDHMILANAKFWNRTCFTCDGNASHTRVLTWQYNLAFQFSRLLGL